MEVAQDDSGAHAAAMATRLQESFAGHRPRDAEHLLADPARARRAVEAASGAGPVFVALDGGELAGYLVAAGGGRLGVAHHAARPDDARLVYRRLYEVAAGHLVAGGARYHSIPVRADDPATVQAFVELEFGLDQIDGIVDVRGATTAGGGTAPVRPATTDDLDVVMELARELHEFHHRSPMFQPARPLDAEAIRAGAAAALDDPDSAVLVAEVDGRVAAMAQAGPSSAYAAAFDLGMLVVTEDVRAQGLGRAVLDALDTWAAARGYRYGTVGWTSSNLVSDAFYRSQGFTPVRYRLHRRIAR